MLSPYMFTTTACLHLAAENRWLRAHVRELTIALDNSLDREAGHALCQHNELLLTSMAAPASRLSVPATYGGSTWNTCPAPLFPCESEVHPS
ncbi:hypothetical protein DFR70_12743 [Nocardia tenerifensis]|uniref:Uncharacterized protein n=1 Tax=Nocardia tenerifensis TaxID=228006 RepID=A0A318JNS5_9NOCA|nr:hypothetical protein [Nocardia tenerifensis]PXX53432.1 hypothetical protein DFR70_12743 [Nocardia tenerifensis]